MPELTRLPDSFKSTLPGAVVPTLAVVVVQLAANLAQEGKATGFIDLALKDLRRIDHRVWQV